MQALTKYIVHRIPSRVSQLIRDMQKDIRLLMQIVPASSIIAKTIKPSREIWQYSGTPGKGVKVLDYQLRTQVTAVRKYRECAHAVDSDPNYRKHLLHKF